MGKQFDLSSLMDTVSKLDTTAAPQASGGEAAPQVQLIPLEDIITNKANFYKVDKASLKPLADSIAMDGLQQYPVVTPHPEQAGKYLLLSGHRRCAAIRMLAEDKKHPREDLRLVPCTVREYRSAAMAELQLILANSTARVLTNAEISKQAERMEILLYQLKEEGYEFPGRMRDQVAAACRVSAPKLARLKVIREKLKAPEFLLLFEKDKLPEQTAYALARLPEAFQKRLAAIKPELTGNTVEMIQRKYAEGWRWEPDIQCPDGKACKRGDSFLRHDLADPFDMCGGKRCCLECHAAKRSWSPCERMCSKAQALRKEKRDDEKASADRQRQKQNRQYQRQTQANAQRVLRAIEAAGLSDDVRIPWESYSTLTAGDIRKYAAGEFPDGKWWYDADLKPNRLHDPAKTARLLGCSVDFLFGLTDELGRPAAAAEPETLPEDAPPAPLETPGLWETALLQLAWIPGKPEQSRQVVARFTLPEGGPVLTKLCWYNALLEQYQFSTSGAAIDAECTGWWPVPEEDSSDADDQ